MNDTERLAPKQGELKKRSLLASAFTIGGFATQNILRLVANLILTRLLFPEAFGLMALVQTFITALNLFSDFGTQPAITRSPNGDNADFLNTAWTMQMLRGLGLWVLLFLMAPSIGAFYEEPLLAAILPVSGLVLILSGLQSTNVATAGRHMVLGRLTALEIGAQVIGLIGTALLAWILQSVWALVFGGLIRGVLFTGLSHVILPGVRNRPTIDRAHFKELFHFGKYIFLSTIAGFFILHADRAILGKFITLDALAMFSIGILFARMPVKLNDNVTRRIILPLYTKKPPFKSAQNREQLAKARWMIALPLLTICGALSIIGDVMVEALYDARYRQAGPILVLAAIGSMPTIIFNGHTRLPVAAGHAGRFAAVQLTLALVQTSLLLWLLSAYGVIAAALAPALAGLAVYPVLVWSCRQYKGINIGQDFLLLVYASAMAACAVYINADALLELLATVRESV